MTRMRKIIALLCLGALVAGCGGGTGDGGGGDRGAQGNGDGDPAAADPDATLRLAHVIAPAQWDPHTGRSTVVDGIFMGHVYDSLLRLDADLEIQPELATEWDLSEDNMALTLTLRDDVTFHDGTPFDAEAVKANVEYTIEADGLGAIQLAMVDEVEVVDEHTVTLHLNEDGTTLPVLLAYHISAGGMVSPQALGSDSLATEPAGSGPYELTQVTQDRAVYEKVDDHWDAELLERIPQRVELITITDDNARLAALRSDQVDAIQVSSPYPSSDELVDEGFQLVFSPTSLRAAIVSLNFDAPALANPDIRRAISMAIDREAIAETIFDGACTPSAIPFGEGTVGYDADAADVSGVFDPDAARDLVEGSGETDLSFELVHISGGLFQNMATVVQAQLAEIGLTAELVGIPSAQTRPEWATGNYDMLVTTQSGAPDPALLLDDIFLGAQMPGGSDPELADLQDAARNLPLGSEERDAAFGEISTYLAENPVNVVICNVDTQVLGNQRVGGLDQLPLNIVSSGFTVRDLYVTGG